MPTFNVTVTQVLRVTRKITIPVEALSMDDAVEKQSEDDAPSGDDPRWKVKSSLENEEVNPARPSRGPHAQSASQNGKAATQQG